VAVKALRLVEGQGASESEVVGVGGGHRGSKGEADERRYDTSRFNSTTGNIGGLHLAFTHHFSYSLVTERTFNEKSLRCGDGSERSQQRAAYMHAQPRPKA
jgi:hypothetical protein